MRRRLRKEQCGARLFTKLSQPIYFSRVPLAPQPALVTPQPAQDNIPAEVITALQPLLSDPNFQPAKIKKVSQAAFGLCSWVRAMDTYDRVAKVVAPKRKALQVRRVLMRPGLPANI